MTTEARPKSFLRRWGAMIAGAVVFLGILVGFRVWTDEQAGAPIAEPYRLFLEHLASISTDAESMLGQYRVKHQRMTVASRHFTAMCALMVREAKEQGGKPELFSPYMTQGCEQAGRAVEGLP